MKKNAKQDLRDRLRSATTIREASAIYARMRDESGLGNSQWPSAKFGPYVISYNAKVWLGDELVFDPYASERPQAAARAPSGWAMSPAVEQAAHEWAVRTSRSEVRRS